MGGNFRRPPALLVAVLFFHLLAVGCAGGDVPGDPDGPVTLRIEENWNVVVERPTSGFLDTVGRNANAFADTAGTGSTVLGCVAGGLTLAAMAQGQGGEVGCLVGGLGLYPFGYALGYGTGAVVGTVQGTINLFAEPVGEIDTPALAAAIESATPELDLAHSLLERARRLSSISLVRPEESVDAGHRQALTTPDEALQLTLTISRLQLTTTSAMPPTSRLRMTVRGELRDSRTGQAIKAGKWRYKSQRLLTTDLASDEAAALRSELAEGWRVLADEIVLDLFDLGRS